VSFSGDKLLREGDTARLRGVGATACESLNNVDETTSFTSSLLISSIQIKRWLFQTYLKLNFESQPSTLKI
jgi:hypothetical protein